MPIRHANIILGNKSNLYRLVSHDDWFLPKEKARSITTNYLFQVMQGSVFRIRTEHVKHYITERVRWSKIDLLSYIQSKHLRDSSFGFGADRLPDRYWLLSILHTFEPSHEVFNGVSESDKLVDVPIKYIPLTKVLR
jgi:hypothetical protein